MSKTVKSKNTILKKAKKFERQGKYNKALNLCDSYLDKSIDESLIQLKIDILVNLYNNDQFINEINVNKSQLTDFLDKETEIQLLKTYNTIDNYIELNVQHMSNEKTLGTYLAGGLLVDNLETILLINEMAKDNREKSEDDVMASNELLDFVENVKKTSYQYLELILENPKGQIESSNFDLEGIISKIRHYLEPNENDEDPNLKEESIEENIDESIDETKKDTIKETIEESIEETIEKSPNTEDQDRESDPDEKAENIEKPSLKKEDTSTIKEEISVEEEIKGLKEIISYLNDKNEFKKALMYQRRLVKLAREENIKAEGEIDSKQRTLSEF